MSSRFIVSFLAAFTLLCARSVGSQWLDVHESPASGSDFPMVGKRTSATVIYSKDDANVVEIAAGLFADDVKRVSGCLPEVKTSVRGVTGPVVLMGTIGRSPELDALIKEKKVDVSAVCGGWEQFRIETVDNPWPGVPQALVIAGSDRRGTAYGAFSISEAMGVSPWYWWADVPARSMKEVYVGSLPFTSKTPGVRYRGIFLNDEDWGLQPWAARHMDTDIKDIGPKTYAKIFELLLRLKANYIWPAMHPCTQAFNSFPQDKIVADDYAIVMGSSHCEPMLRNNVTEWDPKALGEWNYDSNRDGIYDYWETRVKENGIYENVYTGGMRGIHDSDMPGGGSLADKRDRLERVIADQRQILAGHVDPDLSRVPQIFCPYKEVLSIYDAGLQLPDDITIVWPDDNFGYIRNLSTPAERKRSGGSGVYYHLSYWGSPQDFLWISSSSPAKIAYEMHKSCAYGADRLWVFNVGDIKPIEMEMEFALRLAYNPDRWPAEKAMGFIEEWAGRTFGVRYAQEIAEIFGAYYRLTQQVKPEHIDRVAFTEKEQDRRIADYAAIARKAGAIHAAIAPEYRDAFFEMVLYPVQCADLMNRKQTYAVRGDADKAVAAYEGIQELTRIYNKELAGGKWDGMMDAAPRNTRVFNRPDPAVILRAAAKAEPLYELQAADAKCEGLMVMTEQGILAAAPDIQREDTASLARFIFQAKNNRTADLYFLAQCPDDKQDSWHVAFNDSKTLSNDQSTGAQYKWLRIMTVDLRKGGNELVVSQREPGTVIKQVVLMEPGQVPPAQIPDADVVIDAAGYSSINGDGPVHWEKIDGLGIASAAMAVSPYEFTPLDERSLKRAPSLTYTFKGDADECLVEARFLPTHRIHNGMGLRYAVSVDNGPAQTLDINAAEYAADWGANVIRGYSMGRSAHKMEKSGSHTVTLYALDPGIVFGQLRIFMQKGE
jgi:hypothetical protein